MKIGIDARWILNPLKNPAIGVGHYTYQLIRNLLRIDKKNQYILFFDYRVREKDIKKFSQPNVKIKFFPWSDYKKYLPGAYSEILGLATLTKNNLDVLHITSPDARVPIGYHGKVICTFQDLAVFKFPRLFPDIKKIKTKYNRQAMSKRADKIIAVSKNTKKDLKKYLNCQEDKVEVINNAIDERFFLGDSYQGKEVIDELKEKFKINKKYILFIGTLEPIKNITRLLEAFKKFKNKILEKKNHFDYQLVLGGKKGWLSAEYLRIAKDLGVVDDIRFLGYIEGDDLVKLFKNAQIFIMPSLYEGFGMTILEALACKTPTLVSDIPALREIAEDSVEYFNPIDTSEISEKIISILEDGEKYKEKKSQKGFEVARKYSWEKCAKETLELYEKLGKTKKRKKV